MSTINKSQTQESADFQAVVDHAFKGKPVDPEVSKRIDERAAKIQEALRKKPQTDIAVDLIREAREEI